MNASRRDHHSQPVDRSGAQLTGGVATAPAGHSSDTDIAGIPPAVGARGGGNPTLPPRCRVPFPTPRNHAEEIANARYEEASA